MDETILLIAVVLIGSGFSLNCCVLAKGVEKRVLLAASDSDIGLIDNLPDGFQTNNQSLLVKSLNISNQGSIDHLAAHYERDLLFWFLSGQTGSIVYSAGRVRANNLSSPILHFHDRCSRQVTGLSVDWINNNVYWADDAYNWIKMAALSDPVNLVRGVITEGIYQPTALAVHPKSSFIFWADSELQVIKRSDLSGDHQATLVTLLGQTVVALVVDAVTESVVYLSNSFSSYGSIERIATDGSRQITVYQSLALNLFQGLALNANNTFLVKRNGSELGVFSGSNVSSVSIIPQKQYRDIYMFAPEQQTFSVAPCLTAACEQICVTANSSSQVSCLCADGYRLLPDGRSCQANAYLSPPKYFVYLGPVQGYLSFYEVWAADWSDGNHQVLMKGLNSLTALATSFDKKSIIVASSEGYIELIQLSATGNNKNRKYLGVGRVEGISVDWISSNIYFVDSRRGQIMVATSDLSHLFLLHRKVNNPHGIAVDAVNRNIFWSENGPAAIMMSSTDGSNRTRFIYSNLVSPEKLVIDNTKQRLYWTDSGKGTIEYVSLTGNQNRQIFVARPPSALLYGISIFQDYVAWTQRGTNTGIYWRLNSDRNVPPFETVYSLTNPPGEIVLYGRFAEPVGSNACSNENGGCSQICLPMMDSSDEKSCFCTLGYDLASDNISCIPHVLDHTGDDFLLLVDAFHPAIYQLDLDTDVPRIFPLSTNQQPESVTFDCQQQMMYWSDVANSAIHRGSLHENFSEVFLYLPQGTGCYSLNFDNSSELLYFTLNTSGVIYASSTTGNNQTMEFISGLIQPNNIVIDTINREIYWTESSHIGKAKLDNPQTKSYPVVEGEATNIQGLAVHPQWNRIFWCNSTSVFSSNLDGSNQTLIANLGPSAVCHSLAAYDDILYAVDSNNQDIFCINWVYGTLYTLESMPYQKLAGIYVVPISRNTDSNAYDGKFASESAKNGIIVGSVLGAAILILGMVAFILWRQWRKNERPKLIRLHPPQRPRHPSESSPYSHSIRISEDMSQVSYFGRGVFRNSLMDVKRSSQSHQSPYYESWGYGHQLKQQKDDSMGRDDMSDDTSSVISSVSSNSPFVRSNSAKPKQKRNQRKQNPNRKNQHNSENIYDVSDRYFMSRSDSHSTSRTSSQGQAGTASQAAAFHAQYFRPGRSWSDTVNKKF